MPAVPKGWEDTPVTLDGVTKTVREWCQERGLKVQNVHTRKRNSSWAEALTKPVPGSKRWRMEINKKE